MSKLEEMLEYVSEHNEFYKNRIKEYADILCIVCRRSFVGSETPH